MSGLYNALFGTSPSTEHLLALVGLHDTAIPRFRDCYWNGEYVVVHTRTGGGNREYYDVKNDDNPDGPWNSAMWDNPNYVTDEDCEHDSTYADFYFNVPAAVKAAVEGLAPAISPEQKWSELFKALGKEVF